jgi:serine/threonine protein kinase/Flp pilus assembly protein TadD
MAPDDDKTRTHVPLTNGTMVSHYRIIEKIGAGGMGEVYLAEDTELNRRVALKFLPPHLCQDADCRARFKREAQASAKLDHPNIVAVHEVGEFQGRPFFSMQHVEGQTLKEVLSGKPLLIDRILEIGIQVCDGLQAAHEKGITHRDIKPSNILIDSHGRARIADFGLASVMGSDHLTKTGSTLGTIGYMSPEQVRGDKVDHRTDLFSFGVVLYEMITGHAPFKADSEAATLNAITNTKPELLARFRRVMPSELQTIVDKALNKDTVTRYQHADEMAADLKSVRKSSEPTATSRSLRIAASPRRKWAYLIAGLAVIVVMFILIKAYVFKPAGDPLDSLAILPLQNLSGDPAQDYFSDGMTEALITELQKIRSLRVISRTSVMRFKKSSEALPDIAKKLAVKAVVEGSVMRDGENVRITVQLIQVSPEKHLWASNFDRPMRNILSLQSDVARAIAQEIRVIITPVEKKKMASSRLVNREAQEAYLKGRFYWNKRTAPDLERAIEYFNLAIEKEPTYALAHAGLASAYIVLPSYSARSLKEVVLKAKAAARSALQFDTTLAEAYAVLGSIKADYEWDWVGAESEFQRAIELDPSSPTAHLWYHELLAYLGRLDESLAEINRAQELDPLSPVIGVNVGDALCTMGKYSEAINQFRQVLELDSGFVPAHNLLGNVYEVQGEFDEAIREYEKVRELEGKTPFFAPGSLGRVFARAGRRGDAQKILDSLLESHARGGRETSAIASIYLGFGDKDKTFEWLEKAYQERDIGLQYLKVEPWWESLRSDPRFTMLLRKMKLEQ